MKDLSKSYDFLQESISTSSKILSQELVALLNESHLNKINLIQNLGRRPSCLMFIPLQNMQWENESNPNPWDWESDSEL